MLDTPEQLWDQFVPACGGELLRDIVPRNVKDKNADYVFRTANVIAELKSLEQETFTPAYYEKLDALVKQWMRKRRLLIFGTRQISLRRVPKQCQREWLRLVEAPLQRIIADANQQVKSTRKLLNMPNANGVLVLASAGNRSLGPSDIITLVSRIWQKRHPSGVLQYSGLSHLVYFTVHMPVTSAALGRPALFWFSGHRQPDANLTAFLSDLHEKWHGFLQRTLGQEIPRVQLDRGDMENLKFV